MGTIADIARYLVQTAFGFLLFAVLLRLLLQLSRADFYNPVSQFVVRITSPLLLPLRRVVPPFGRLDSASVVLALLIQCVATVVVLAMLGFSLGNPLMLIPWALIGIASLLLKIYFFAILGVIIFSWIAPHSNHPALALLHQITEPVMTPFRRLLPSMGGIDLSPILVFVSINVLEIVVRRLAQGVGLPGGVVLGF
jgi:YggT family protein